MGRPHKAVTVVIAMDAHGKTLSEDIVPNSNFIVSGSLMLNVADARRTKGVRMISVRSFNDSGQKTTQELRYYGQDGRQVEPFHRRPDGSIIEVPNNSSEATPGKSLPPGPSSSSGAPHL